MCLEAKPIRSVVLFEGPVQWIMERETAEERLAAWETVCAIAFPKDEAKPYEPPLLPADGKKLSSCDRVRRDAFNIFKGVIESRAMKANGKMKDPKKVEAGRMGAAKRFGKNYGESSAMDGSALEAAQKAADAVNGDRVADAKPVELKVSTVTNTAHTTPFEDDFTAPTAGARRKQRKLTPEEQERQTEWDRKIPDEKALQKWLQDGYVLANKNIVVSDEFCLFAYTRLAKEDRWISTRDGTVLKNIFTPIHYLALDYKRKMNEIRRAEEEEKAKDMVAEQKKNEALYSDMSPSDLASIERKRRRAAERAQMEQALAKG